VTRRDAGTTLVELVVALLILALTAGVATLAIRSLRPPSESGFQAALLDARARAIREGHPVRVTTDAIHDSLSPRIILFLPDGRTLGAANDSE
jgi:Tfp pilus assembly protein FimT